MKSAAFYSCAFESVAFSRSCLSRLLCFWRLIAALLPHRTHLSCQVHQPHQVAAGNELVAVLGEGGVVPWRFVQRPADEPAVAHVVAQLLDDLPFNANAEQHLQHQWVQQFLRRNRLATGSR